MNKHNVNNERIKRKYLTFLKQAKGQHEGSIDCVAKAIARFEVYAKYKDFKAFHFEQAIGFKKHLATQKHHKTNKPLSAATLNGTLRHLKAFIQWLSQEIGYKSRLKYSDAEYFNLSEKETRLAKTKRHKPTATLEQIKHALDAMPTVTATQKRDKALVAFTLLTGARDSAIASFKLKHVNFDANSAYQDARDVKTKFSKTFTTYFFPVGDDIRNIVLEWVEHLKREHLFGHDDPLFPKSAISKNSDGNFQASGQISTAHWGNASAIRRVFKQAFEAVDLPYFNPHSFRNTLAVLGEKLCQTPEEFKAWSQNLGHEGVLTTLYSYGEVQEGRQAELIANLKKPRTKTEPNMAALVKAVAKEIGLRHEG